MKTTSVLAILGAIGTVFAVEANPLPAPRSINWWGDGPIPIDPVMELTSNVDSYIVVNAFNRALQTVLGTKWVPAAIEKPISSFLSYPTGFPNSKRGASTPLKYVDVVVEDAGAPLQLGVNETYTLSTAEGDPSIKISAATIWGVLHAFTTLQQLILYDDNDSFYIEKYVSIWDAPLYPHRGLLIDSGRNFLLVDLILEQVDIMALAKLNTLHWHIEDLQLWPVQLTVYPEMIKDAYSKREVYQHQDIRRVVEYATERGVRVIPELDLPGHCRAGYRQVDPNLVACGDSWWSNDNWDEHTAVEPPAGQLLILYNKTYEVVKNVYNEVASLFDDNVFHVGADELQSNCYKFTDEYQQWIKSNKTIQDLSQYWVDNALPLFEDKPERRLMMWEDILLTPEGAHTIPQNVILQLWNNDLVNIQNLTLRGFDVVVLLSSHFYLDCGYGGFVTNDPRYIDVAANEDFNDGLGGSWCAPYKTWQRIYTYDFTANLTDAEKLHVLGAEVAMWSEQVDSTVLTQKVWPRAAALAESTWSGNRNENGFFRTTELTQRIFNFREYLVALGHGASPLVPKFCLQNPHACDLHYNQSITAEFQA